MQAVSLDAIQLNRIRVSINHENSISPYWTLGQRVEYGFNESRTIFDTLPFIENMSFRAQEFYLQLGVKRYFKKNNHYNGLSIGVLVGLGWEIKIEDGYEEAHLKSYTIKYERQIPHNINVGIQAGYKWNFALAFFLEPKIEIQWHADDYFAEYRSVSFGTVIGLGIGYRFDRGDIDKKSLEKDK